MKIRKFLSSAVAAVTLVAGIGVAATSATTANAANYDWRPEGVAWMAPAAGEQNVYRFYNRALGKHHYSQNPEEIRSLVGSGWTEEGVAFHASATGNTVYRLYNPHTSEHLFTLSVDEKNVLASGDWIYEGPAWHVNAADSVAVYRAYNPKLDEHLWTTNVAEYQAITGVAPAPLAKDALNQLTVSDYLAPDYERDQFGESWVDTDGNGCRTRDDILTRDLENVTKLDNCRVATGTLNDPYTGTVINFARGTDSDNDGGVQIDHVVALSNAWKSGANGWTYDQRVAYANDPYVLLAVDDQANQDKRDYSADRWLPSSRSYQCDYVARQIGIKSKYKLTVTYAERDAMSQVLATCPTQTVPAGVGAPSTPAPAPEPEPAPNPEPTPNPNPAPNPQPQPNVQYGINPGGWCSPEGAIGYSKTGKQYSCRPSNSGKSLHWRVP